MNRKLLVHTMGRSMPGMCCDMESTSVAWSSSLHSLLSFRMKSSLQRRTDSSTLSNLPTSSIQVSLVLYSESFKPSNAIFIAIGTFNRNISAILCNKQPVNQSQNIKKKTKKEKLTRTSGSSGSSSSRQILTSSSNCRSLGGGCFFAAGRRRAFRKPRREAK